MKKRERKREKGEGGRRKAGQRKTKTEIDCVLGLVKIDLDLWYVSTKFHMNYLREKCAESE